MERSCGFLNEQMSAELASDKYIELEHTYNELGEAIKDTEDYRKQKVLRRKRRAVRAEQNLLYPYMVGTGYVRYTEEILNLKGNQALYGRYVRSKGKVK